MYLAICKEVAYLSLPPNLSIVEIPRLLRLDSTFESTTVFPPIIIAFLEFSLLISSFVTSGIKLLLVSNIGEFKYVAKGVADNPSDIANPFTITIVSALLNWLWLNFTAVPYLSLPANVTTGTVNELTIFSLTPSTLFLTSL